MRIIPASTMNPVFIMEMFSTSAKMNGLLKLGSRNLPGIAIT